MKSQTEFPIIEFRSQNKWRQWLTKNHSKSDGAWLRLYKKDSGVKSINHDMTLDEALCFGWIDGQAKSYDEQSYLQRSAMRSNKIPELNNVALYKLVCTYHVSAEV